MNKKNIIQKSISLMLIFCMLIINPVTSIKTEAATSNDYPSAIHFIDCGSGNATLLESANSNGKVFGLIDGGSDNDADYNKVTSYLDSKLGGAKLSFIIVTHLDKDHAGGIMRLLSEDVPRISSKPGTKYVNNETVLYIKNTKASLEAFKNKTQSSDATNWLNRYNTIRSKGKTLGMPVSLITPTISSLPKKITDSKNVAEATTNLKSLLTPDMMKTTFKNYKLNAAGTYATNGTSNNIILGDFTINLYNGHNWYDSILKGNSWNENVNSVTAFIRCATGPKKAKVYSTYLASDLGAYTNHGYSHAILEKAVEACNKNVSIFQVPHHGYYGSITAKVVEKLAFKHSIITTSYSSIGTKSAPDGNKYSTLDALRNSKIYYTGGSNSSNPGTVIAEFGSTLAMIHRNN